MLRCVALVLALAGWVQVAFAAPLDVAYLRDGQVTALRVPPSGAATPAPFDGRRRVPLASLWKLFVYVHAADRKLPMPDYTCTGQQPREEVYCCERGASIERDAALAQSCGLFFSPSRLMLERRAWKDYWAERLGHAPTGETAWLADPARLGPERIVTLRSLLQALASIPAESRAQAESALLRVVLGARGADTVGVFGSALRVKTYSWHEKGRRLGGAAGWLADGTPIWFGSEGTSQTVMRHWAPRLAAVLPPARTQLDAGCVIVDYFTRYPLRSVTQNGKAAQPGILKGKYAVAFENGSSLSLVSHGELLLSQDSGKRLQLTGRLGVNEYVARVVDREGSAAQPEAAKALAIAARTYLQQNGVSAQGCQRIADSSATQRVSPSPATPAARAIAHLTDQLVLTGANVRYHADTSAPDTMSWTLALEQAADGKRFDDILLHAYPRAELGTMAGGARQCVRLAAAESWLARELPRWERVLRSEPGYERPGQLPAVCRLGAGMPYSEQSRNRIFARGVASPEERITLAHEYLHLGLRNHPRGHDEQLVEQLARRLVAINLERQP